MSDCPIRLKAKATITDAQRRRIWVGVYRVILDCVGRTKNQTAKEGIAQEAKTMIPKKKGAS